MWKCFCVLILTNSLRSAVCSPIAMLVHHSSLSGLLDGMPSGRPPFADELSCLPEQHNDTNLLPTCGSL